MDEKQNSTVSRGKGACIKADDVTGGVRGGGGGGEEGEVLGCKEVTEGL